MNRLDAIASFVDENSVVCDIGCDHAYLLINLIKCGKIAKGYGVDNKIGPLNNAKANIAKFNIEGIKLILADGLNFDIDKDINTIVLAGMGGMLIKRILLEGRDKLTNIKTIIIDAHRDTDEVINVLTKIGYEINKRMEIVNKKKQYQILRFDRKG